MSRPIPPPRPVPPSPRLFNHYPELFRPTTTPAPFRDGASYSGARLWSAIAPAGRLLIRAWPDPPSTRTRIERIHCWVVSLRELSWIAVPWPMLDRSTLLEFDGTLWQLEPWLSGEPRLTTVQARPADLSLALHSLATLHRRLAGEHRSAVSATLVAHAAEWSRLEQGGLDELAHAIPPAGRDPLSSQLATWLAWMRRSSDARRPSFESLANQPIPLQPCLRDARPEHFLFGEKGLTGLVDYGAMDVDTVCLDLARLLGPCLPPPPCDLELNRMLDLYARDAPLEVTGRRLVAELIHLAHRLVPARWARWIYLENRRDVNIATLASRLERMTRLRPAP